MNMQRILHGDCFELLPSIPDGSIDMILTDPPYARTACKWDTPIDIPRMMQEFFRLIKPNGAIVITATQPFATDVISAGRKYFRYDLIWEKKQGVGFLNAKKMPLRKHEIALVFYKRLPTFNPQRQPSNHPNTGSRLRSRTNNVYGQTQRYATICHDDGFRMPTSVVRVPEPERGNANRLHPTQKPLALFELLIKTYTNEGDTVLDPFAGSGTTAEACARTNRGFIAIEALALYYNAIKTRLATIGLQGELGLTLNQ
jgi:site-specific DNA-methyltransferase (adenine-specific)